MVDTEHIQLAHGGGGQLTTELLADVILPALGGQDAASLTDAAILLVGADGRLAFTTDSYVVKPLEFPGGDIGKLAVFGTVNDLAVTGAVPKALSLSLVLEEGLEISLLRRVLDSAGAAARQVDVEIVTGDTKVVERGACDGMIVNTSGVGRVLPEARLGFDRVTPGDRIILSGPLGEHGLAVMSRRKGLRFSGELCSDCGPIDRLAVELVEKLGPAVRFMRDPTRGGLAATLAELSAAAGVDLEVEEARIPTNRTVRVAAEMLGLDVLTVANEGKLVVVVAPERADEAVMVLREHEISRRGAVIGTVSRRAGADAPPLVEMVTTVGGRRIVQMPYGRELPRIC